MSKYLKLDQVCKSFTQGDNKITVLQDLNFNFDFTKTYAITGVSGSGKSTLIHLLAAVDQPDSGQISWCGQFDVSQLTSKQKEQYWNQQVGLIFQQANLINELTVLENVAIKGLISNQADVYSKATQLLQTLDLAHRLNFFPDVLSRGEQQRVAIARAVMCNAGLILADEPTASLDQANGINVIKLLIDLVKVHQIGLIVSTHDEYVSKQMDCVLTLENGKLKQI
jgi:ABC-type lipoprotein export system ATPase subunit